MKLDVFGRHIEVVKEEGQWVVYAIGEGRKRRSNEIAIPAEYNEAQVIAWIEDMFHEAATPEKPSIIKMSA